jgi:hypothetical protein
VAGQPHWREDARVCLLLFAVGGLLDLGRVLLSSFVTDVNTVSSSADRSPPPPRVCAEQFLENDENV